jgi:diguanylate cyclase (GGDEF)-like protein
MRPVTRATGLIAWSIDVRGDLASLPLLPLRVVATDDTTTPPPPEALPASLGEWADLVCEEDRPAFAAAVRAAQRREGFTLPFREAATGERRLISARWGTPENQAASVLTGYVMNLQEGGNLLAELNDLRDRVLRAEGTTRALMLALPDSVLILDSGGNYIEAYIPDHVPTDDPRASPVGRNLFDIWPARLAEDCLVIVRRVLQTRRFELLNFETEISGRMHIFESRYVPLDENRVLIVRRDVTERVSALRTVQNTLFRLETALDGGRLGFWEMNLADQLFTGDERWARLLCHNGGEVRLLPHQAMDLVHPEDRPAADEALRRLSSGEVETFDMDLRMRRFDGSYIWCETHAKPLDLSPDGTPVRLIGTLREIHERKLLEEKLIHAASHDELTGALNRRGLLELLEARACEIGACACALVAFDLDGFRFVNETYGAPVGDSVLLQIVERMRALVPAPGLVVRIGGDCFAAHLPEVVDASEATRLAEQLRELHRIPFLVEGAELFINSSFGIRVIEPGEPVGSSLLSDLELAIDESARSGSGVVTLFRQDMLLTAKRRVEITSALRYAAARGELDVVYQPIVRLADGELDGFEALVRWNHPVLGRVRPDQFIPIAEESGLILQIGEHVLREACARTAAWRAEFGCELSININVATAQLRSAAFVGLVESVLRDTGLPAHALHLEITEGAFIHDPDRIGEALTELKGLGVLIELDDFGTGYSSLSWLSSFPIDVVKIDRSFIDRMEHNEDAFNLAAAMISLCTVLRLGIIAEGLEVAIQLRNLRDLACPHAQGFLLSEPVTAGDVPRLLAGPTPWRRHWDEFYRTELAP